MIVDVLHELVSRVRVVLIDFDGPLCSVFSEQPAPAVAHELSGTLAALQGKQVLDSEATDDPMEVLRQAVPYGPAVVAQIDEALAVAELSAIQAGAEPTPGSERFLHAIADSGRQAAIVTNNAERAAQAYLTHHGLTEMICTVVGRQPGRPELMKPNGWPLQRALTALSTSSRQSLFIGDTESDILAARAVGAYVIGYANKPGKYTQLAAADVVIDSMATLAIALESSIAT